MIKMIEVKGGMSIIIPWIVFHIVDVVFHLASKALDDIDVKILALSFVCVEHHL